MSEYTTNYELDKYSSYDKPNLRDQYNSAMDKIDTALHEMHVDVYDAKETAQRADQAVSGETQARTDADTALQTAIDNEALARGNADTQLRTDFEAADTQLRTDFEGADTQLREDFTTADTSLGNRISALETAKTYVGIIGDSYSDASLGANWVTAFANNVKKNVVNVADNGSGLVRVGSGRGTTFKTQLEELIANPHFSEMDTIIVYGGFNDRGRTDNELITAADDFMSTYRSAASIGRLPRLLFVYGNSGHCTYFGDTCGSFKNYPAWLTNARRTLRARGVPVIEGAEYWLMCTPSNVYQSDHVHPNADGYAQISAFMASVYYGDYGGVHRYYNEPVAPTEGVTVQSYGRAILKFDNGVTQMAVGGLTFNPNTLTDPQGALCNNFAGDNFATNYGSGLSLNDGLVYAETPALRLSSSGSTMQICRLRIHRFSRVVVPAYQFGYANIDSYTYDVPLTNI